jgi:hypothetical protein
MRRKRLPKAISQPETTPGLVVSIHRLKITHSREMKRPDGLGIYLKGMVGASGFEPPASWSRTRRASQAALRPDRQAPGHDKVSPGGMIRIA